MKTTRSRLQLGASRRTVLKGMGAGAVALSAPSIVRGQAGTVRLGFVSPQTGPLALFGETDSFALSRVRGLLENGLETETGTYNVEIIEKDGQSDPNRAAEVAADLILNDDVHMIIPASTTDTVSPVADQAELFGCPCLSSGAPWQAVIFPRGGGETPFTWTYHFFWGLDEALNTFVGLWNALETNRRVGMLFPQNGDGETWGNTDYGLPAPTRATG